MVVKLEGKSQSISIQAREEVALGKCLGSLHSHRYVPSHPLIPSSTCSRLTTRLQPLLPALLALFPSVNIIHPVYPATAPVAVHSLSRPPQDNPLPVPSVAYHVTSICPLPPSSCPGTGPSACLPICLSILCLPPLILKSTLALTPHLSFVNCSAV